MSSILLTCSGANFFIQLSNNCGVISGLYDELQLRHLIKLNPLHATDVYLHHDHLFQVAMGLFSQQPRTYIYVNKVIHEQPSELHQKDNRRIYMSLYMRMRNHRRLYTSLKKSFHK